jgi:hypothetical protein
MGSPAVFFNFLWVSIRAPRRFSVFPCMDTYANKLNPTTLFESSLPGTLS